MTYKIIYLITRKCKICQHSHSEVHNEKASDYEICDECYDTFKSDIENSISKFKSKISYFKRLKLNPIEKIAYKKFINKLKIKEVQKRRNNIKKEMRK